MELKSLPKKLRARKKSIAKSLKEQFEIIFIDIDSDLRKIDNEIGMSEEEIEDIVHNGRSY